MQFGDDLGDVNAMDTPLCVGAVKAWGLIFAGTADCMGPRTIRTDPLS
ncbi:MAG: hypothetical protein ACKVPZ_03515 [Burkholderiaceae bacterium]